MSDTDLPAVTVIVPAFNAEATIEECARSLLALRYPSEQVEILVVDNGSNDGTRSVLERFGDRITIVDEPRRGPAAARNAGVRRARGEVVAFTDADCTVEPLWLRELVQPLRDPAVGVVGGRILAREGANEAELFGELIHDHEASICIWQPPYVITMSWASRRAVLEAVGLFDDSLRRCEDVDLSYRISRAGYTLVYQPDAVVRHRNERSLLGLCREGWQHGFYACPVVTRHADYIVEARDQSPLVGVQVSDRRLPSKYGRAFRGGKRLGRTMGRAWLLLPPDKRGRQAAAEPRGK